MQGHTDGVALRARFFAGAQCGEPATIWAAHSAYVVYVMGPGGDPHPNPLPEGEDERDEVGLCRDHGAVEKRRG